MMHGFGLPIFMGGPFIWILVLIGGYFLARRILGHHGKSRDYDSSGFGYTRKDPGHSAGRQGGSIETAIYRLAAGLGGIVTVSDVVTEFGIEPKKAEKILESMADGVRVRMEVNEKGMVYYSFPELKK